MCDTFPQMGKLAKKNFAKHIFSPTVNMLRNRNISLCFCTSVLSHLFRFRWQIPLTGVGIMIVVHWKPMRMWCSVVKEHESPCREEIKADRWINKIWYLWYVCLFPISSRQSTFDFFWKAQTNDVFPEDMKQSACFVWPRFSGCGCKYLNKWCKINCAASRML